MGQDSASRLTALPLPAPVRAMLQQLIDRHSIAHLWIFVSPTLATASAAAQAFLLDWLGAPAGSGCHPDFLKLHPFGKAGLHSVASVRRMLEQLSLAPLGSVGRAVLIDAADRMAPPTSNALLKALEEPPLSTTIVLTTSAPHLLLPTILSRSQVVRLPGQPSASPLDLSALTELLASSAQPSYSQFMHACEAIQKELAQEQARLSKELAEDGGEDLSAATKQEMELEAEGGCALWAQNTSKGVLEAVYLALRNQSSADPVSLIQNLLQAMNGIDRGVDLSTMLLWYLYTTARPVAIGA